MGTEELLIIEGVTLHSEFTEADISDVDVRNSFAAYCESTPLNPVEFEIYNRFLRVVLLPLKEFMRQWRELKGSEVDSIDEIRVYRNAIITLFSCLRFADQDTEISTWHLYLRCLSPLPQDIFINEYFKSVYENTYLLGQKMFKNPLPMSLPEYALNLRATHEIAQLLSLLLIKYRVDIIERKRSAIVEAFDWILIEEYNQRMSQGQN